MIVGSGGDSSHSVPSESIHILFIMRCMHSLQPIELPQLGGQDIGKVYLEVMDSVPPLTGKNSADRILSDNFHAFMLGFDIDDAVALLRMDDLYIGVE